MRMLICGCRLQRLQANKDAKQEAFDEKMKLSNQFRGIDQEESVFLADVQAQKQREERAKRNEELEELNRFRK
ncbi:hypothetical protein FA09DRAFT_329934 [Tilletiopsis washingtonensis]|jgi:hypothetical protein|uniref:FAM192A/Fyv6 N-terminal domain-containing protein n=1 Tax=Tilletiopsis washingtonensis TaxID=58919 RepID=A0A316ZBD3_9BASI|nr:hypothetical protein FA09DRAFT_329934 [Tilletiopsis washingtonensis]PWN98338.1 hypothetical protein FA09DRAFT_329934 [Tilletiopsis washingtonensis]